MHKPTAEMGDDLELAKKAWRAAEDEEGGDIDEDLEIREGMKGELNRRRITQRELHDATLLCGLAVPERPSLLNYFTALHAQLRDENAGFPQTAPASARGFLLLSYSIAFAFQDFPLPPTCLDLPRLA